MGEARPPMPQDKAPAGPGQALVRPVALLMVAQVLDKGFYLAREMLVTARFGLGSLTDAFSVGLYVSSFILALLRPLIEDTFIPVYVGRLARDREDAQRMLESSALLVVLIAGSLVAGAYVFAPQVVAFVAPGFPPETLDLGVQVVRVMAAFTLVLVLTNFTLSVLTAHRAFLLVGFSPLAATAVVVVGIWFFSGTLGIQSLTWGLVAGTAVQLGVLVVGLRRRRLVRLRVELRVREALAALGTFTLLMLLVRLIGMGVGWVDRSLSSRLIAGSMASLDFATNIYQLPFQVCVLAITTVTIAQFSWHAAQDNVEELKREFALAVRIAAFFLIPSTVALIALREPVVRVLYERGAFGAGDTALTASVLLCYALGLVPQSVVFIAARLFLARQEAHGVLLVVLTDTAVHTLFALVLVGPMRQAGIALAMSLGMTAASVVSLWLARRRLGPLGGRAILVAFAKTSLAALGMGVVLWTVQVFLAAQPTVVVVIACVGIGLIGYLALAYLLRLAELRAFIAVVLRRVRSPGAF